MRHLPNLLTLANLFCGCIAISFILSAQNFTTALNFNEYVEVPAVEQPYWGAVFIFIAAIFDLLDGFAARSLKIFSSIGKDLDSLADLVSFGVAPSMILFKLLWLGYMMQPEALDVSLLAMAPAFLVACFGALRLARFNVSDTGKGNEFKGLPIPAVGILIATFPLIMWYDTTGLSAYLFEPWIIYLIIAILCWLMVSKVTFFKMLPSSFSIGRMWAPALVILTGLVALPFLKFAAITLAFVVYIILSIVHKPNKA